MKSERWNSRQEHKNRLYAFLLSVLAGLLFVVPYLIKNGGFYYLGSDFVEQQTVFWTYCNAAVKRGDILWAPTVDLGTSFIGAFCFYVIGSPFFWLSLLIPPQYVYLFMGPLLVLKMGVCGLAAYCYLRQYVREPRWAILCSLLYTFSGYQISNMNFNHFYDVTALFPFLLLALDQTVQCGKRGWFAVTVTLLALVNPVFFAGTVVFLILYVVVRVACGSYRLTRRLFWQLAGESLLGAGASAILVLPCVFSLLHNPRVEQAGFTSLWQMLALKPIYWAELVRGMLFPAECIFDRAFYMQGFTNGAELYLPVFGLVLAFAWCWKHRNSWISRLLLVCAVFAVVPVLNSAFVMFNSEYYTRWYYMPILILCVATAAFLDDESCTIKPGVWFYGGLWAALGLVAVWFIYYFHVVFVFNLAPAVVFFAISLGGFGLTVFVRRLQKKRWGVWLLTAALVLCSGATGLINTYYHARTRQPEVVHALDTVSQQVVLPQTEEGYRINSRYYFMNLGTMLDTPTVSTFASNISGSLFDFYRACGIPRSVISQPALEQDWLQAFLSVGYHVVPTAYDSLAEPERYTEVLSQGEYQVGVVKDTVPMGYRMDRYLSQQDFSALTPELRQAALLQALVLTPEQIDRYGHQLQPLAVTEIQNSPEALKQICAEKRAVSAEKFAYTNTGAQAEIQLSEPGLVLFTIPYDPGFTVYVNGQQIEPEKVDDAFYAVPCQAGRNQVEFRYCPVGLRAGIAISLLSVLLGLGWMLWYRKKGRQNDKA